MPPGTYSVCFEAWNSIGAVSAKVSNYSCVNISIGNPSNFSQSLNEPPKTILPLCNSKVTLTTPQNVVFTWIDPSSTRELGIRDMPLGLQEYVLKIVQVVGNKSANEAMASATTPPFFEKTIMGTSYVYGPADPPLQAGEKYAYTIAVKDMNKNKYQNKGISNACIFTCVAPEVNTDSPTKDTKPTKSAPSAIKFDEIKTFQPIPFNTIKGKLIYAFKKSEEAKKFSNIISASVTFPANMSTPIKINDGFSLFDANGYLPSEQNKKNATDKNATNLTFVKTSNSAHQISVSNIAGVANSSNIGKITKAALSPYEQASGIIAENAGVNKFPLANTKVTAALILKQEITELYKKNNKKNVLKAKIYAGSAITDKEGNFAITFSNPNVEMSFYDVEIYVENPQFTFPAVPIPYHSDLTGVYDIGTILGLANTFRLNLKIIGQDGKPISKADVQIRRQTNIYNAKPYLNPEGNRFLDIINGKIPQDTVQSVFEKDEYTTEEFNIYQGLNFFGQKDNNSVLVSSSKIGYDIFPRLFESNGSDEKYIISVNAEGYEPLKFPLEFWSMHNIVFNAYALNSYLNDNGVMQLDVVYHLSPKPPRVVGRVVSKQNEVALKDAQVILTSKDEKTVYTAKTNAEGKFSISDIKQSSEPYTLTIKGDDISTYTDPQKIFLDMGGITVKKDPIYVDALMIPIVGVVAEKNVSVISNAELRWKSGGKAFYSNDKGIFTTSNRPGQHILIVKKPGFREKEVPVEIKSPTSKASLNSNLQQISKGDYIAMVSDFINATNNTGNTKKGSASNSVIDLAQQSNFLQSFGYNSSTATLPTSTVSKENLALNSQHFIENTMGKTNSLVQLTLGNLVTLDTIFLSRFYVKITVKDEETKASIVDATVEVPDQEGKSTTDANGVAIVSNVMQGAPTIWVYGPSGKNYIPVSTEVTVSGSKDTSEATVFLKGGAVISGKVTSKGTALKGAQIFVEGKPFIKTLSNSSGNYTLSIPTGEYTIKAVKSGLIGDAKSQEFEKKGYTINFDLQDPGFNASKLLGFDITLDKSEPTSNPDEFIISGAFQNIPSNSFFKFPASKSLEFKNIVIQKKGDIIIPKDGKVVTTCSQIPLNLWDYIKLVLETPSGIVVKPLNGDNTKGVISGDLKIDVAGSFGTSYGLKWATEPLKLISNKSTEIPVFTSTSNPLDATSLSFSGSKDGWEIYGVKLSMDFDNTKIDTKGISFAGSLKISGIPGLSNTTLALEKLRLTTTGNIQECSIKVTPNPEFSLLGWKLKINSAKINQYGLNFGGGLEISIPGTTPTTFDFTNLGISANSFTGGSFFVPNSGVNIFGIVNYKGINGAPLSFSKKPAKDAYKINGSGTLSFSQYISKTVDIDNFTIATDGEFALAVRPNFQVSFGDLAELKITSLGLAPTEKRIDVGGLMKLNIPGIGAGASAKIHYKPGNVSVEDLSFSASAGGIGSLKISKFTFKGNGFEGDGALDISGFGNIGLYMKYYKLKNGFDIGAAFNVSTPIPLGPVTWEKPGGGFSINTATSNYDVNLTGRLTLAPGTSATVALDDIKVGVSAEPKGPSFYGKAIPTVITMKVGNADFKFSVPEKLFYIKAVLGGSFKLIPGANISGNAGLTLSACVKPSNQYWLLAYYNNVDILGLYSGYTNIAGGWGPLKSEFPAELSFVPDDYLTNGRVYGLNFACSSHQGIPEGQPLCAHDPYNVAKLCLYAYTNMDLFFYSNFKNNSYGLGINSNWGYGGSIDFFGYGIGGFNFGVNLGLTGGYSNYWYINGNASTNLNGWVGLCASSSCGNGVIMGCCVDTYFFGEVCPCPCGVKTCFGIGVSASYKSSDGKFNIGLDW